MKSKVALVTAAVLIAAALPLGAARAQHVSVRIDTPEVGIRIGNPYPRVVYAPVYAPPVYAPPPMIVAPAPVYYPAPHYVAPRVIVPAPIGYHAPWYGPRGHWKKHWKHRHRHWD